MYFFISKTQKAEKITPTLNKSPKDLEIRTMLMTDRKKVVWVKKHHKSLGRLPLIC